MRDAGLKGGFKGTEGGTAADTTFKTDHLMSIRSFCGGEIKVHPLFVMTTSSSSVEVP